MLKGLDELSMELELKDQNTREIITAYHKAELERVDLKVFRSLEENYPPLKYYFDSIRSIGDPIANIEWQETQIKKFKLYCSVLGPFLESKKDNAGRKDLAGMFDKINTISDLFEKYYPIVKQFYLGVAKEVKAIASDKRVGIEQIVNDVDCVGSIIKKVFPERQEAEKYFETSKRVSMEVTIALGDLINHLGKFGINLPQQALKPIPTQEDLTIIQKAMSDYKTKEFDRIYSRNK